MPYCQRNKIISDTNIAKQFTRGWGTLKQHQHPWRPHAQRGKEKQWNFPLLCLQYKTQRLSLFAAATLPKMIQLTNILPKIHPNQVCISGIRADKISALKDFFPQRNIGRKVFLRHCEITKLHVVHYSCGSDIKEKAGSKSYLYYTESYLYP